MNELNLEVNTAVNLDAVFKASKVFPNLVRLGFLGASEFWVSLDQSAAFCKRVISSYPRLTSLFFTDVGLGNKIAAEIVGYLKQHQSLESIG